MADDMGKLRFQFRFFHKPLFGWKGSFVVTQVSISAVEKYELYMWIMNLSIIIANEKIILGVAIMPVY